MEAWFVYMSILPIPGDPVTLPCENSDPIRGPIFIEADTECLKQDKINLFQEFSEDSWAQRLFLFREAIVKRYGFKALTRRSPVLPSAPTTSTSTAQGTASS